MPEQPTPETQEEQPETQEEQPETQEEQPETPGEQSEGEEAVSPERDLADRLLVVRDMILNTTDDIESLVFTAKLKDSNFPAVVVGGNQLDFTELAVQVATRLRERVLARISGRQSE